MQDVMLDLETLDTRPSAVILSIGAVRFDCESETSPVETFHAFVDIDSNLRYGRTVSGSTILWWLDQDVQARRKILEGTPQPLEDVLADLSKFIRENDRVWGNGAAFDNAILADAYRSVQLKQPWRFWNDMCFRTFKNAFRDVKPLPFEGIAHDALDDAYNQARHLQRIVAHTRGLVAHAA